MSTFSKRISIPAIFLTMAVAPFALAEETSIALSLQDQTRLGIVTEAVAPVDSKTGIRVPALVTHSPDGESRLLPRYAGVVKQWHRVGGENIAAGQPVVTLSSAELMRAEEAWLAARNQLATMTAELAKDRQLFNDGIISKQRLQQTERNHQQAEFNRDATQRQLSQAGVDEADLQQVLKGTLPPGDYVLRAPQDGQLSRMSYQVGDVIEANALVASVTRPEALWLRAEISAGLAEPLQVGQRLRVVEDTAVLTLISKNAELDANTQTVDILARFDELGRLRPGQRVTLVLSSAAPGVKVPATAVTHSEDKTYVYVRRAEGIEVRQLSLAPLGRDYLASCGLVAGEELVVQGTAQLKGIRLGLGGGE